MECKEVILEFLMAYLDKELPAERVAVFEHHLSICPSCVNYLRSYEQTRGLSQELRTLGVDTPLPETLVQAVLAAQRSSPG